MDVWGLKLVIFTINPTQAASEHHKKTDLIAVVKTIDVQVPLSAKKHVLKELEQQGLLAEQAPVEETKQVSFMTFTTFVLRSTLLRPQFLETTFF